MINKKLLEMKEKDRKSGRGDMKWERIRKRSKVKKGKEREQKEQWQYGGKEK
jgi:hypothetical protein